MSVASDAPGVGEQGGLTMINGRVSLGKAVIPLDTYNNRYRPV